MSGHPILHPTDQTQSVCGLGKLNDGSAAAVNKHLEQCSDCRKRVPRPNRSPWLTSDPF